MRFRGVAFPHPVVMPIHVVSTLFSFSSHDISSPSRSVVTRLDAYFLIGESGRLSLGITPIPGLGLTGWAGRDSPGVGRSCL
jgi:hypothetical protein